MRENAIINIRTQNEFYTLVNRLHLQGFYRISPGDLKGWNIWPRFQETFCIRLAGKIVNHDDIDFYRRNWASCKILTIEEYFKMHDPEFARPSLNKKMVEAIREAILKG